MSIETAVFVVHRGGRGFGCKGSDLKGKLSHRDLLAAQQYTDTARHWEYRKSTVNTTKTWKTQSADDIESALGFTPTKIGNGSIEVDMFRGDDNTIYYIYYNYLLKSTDGFTWEIVNDDLLFHAKGLQVNLEEGYRCQGSYIDGNMFVIVLGYIYRSGDNGVTWSLVSSSFSGSYYHNDFVNQVRKATNTVTGQSMLYCHGGKYDRDKSYMLYSLDEGQSFTRLIVYAPRARRIQYHEKKNQFLFLSDNAQAYNLDNLLYKLTFDQVLSNSQYPDLIDVDIYSGRDGGSYDGMVVTPDYIMIWGYYNSYLLDNDYNATLFDSRDGDCAWNNPRHGWYVRYDPACDDVLYGVTAQKYNSTSLPVSGRAYVAGMKAGNLCTDKYANRGPTESENSAGMIYHPPTKRYYQAQPVGVYYSFEQEPGEEDFFTTTVAEITDNLDDIEDDYMFCCTDTDGVTYKVTGAQFIEMLEKFLPSPYTEEDCHIFIANGKTVNIPTPDGAAVFISVNKVEVTSSSITPAAGDIIHAIFDWDNKNSKKQDWFSDILQFGLNSVTGVRNQLKDGKYAFYYMEANPEKIKDLNVSNVQSMLRCLSFTTSFNQDIGRWDVSNVPDTRSMFYGAEAFNQDIGGWNVSSVTDMNSMFRDMSSPFNHPLGAWNVSNVGNMTNMFNGLASFNQDLSQWCVTKIGNKPDGFDKDCIGWNNNSEKPCWGHCPRGENGVVDPCPDPNATPWDDYDIIYHVIVTDPADINVDGADSIYNKDTLEKVAVINAPGEWIIGTESGTRIGGVRFYGSSGTWEFGELTDVSKSTNMMGLFENSSNFNGDISGFDTGNVTDMTAMFTNCSAFNQDISGWDTHSLQVAMTTFKNASNFNQDLSGWCVPLMSSPYSHMSFMDGAGSLAKEPVWGTCPRGENQRIKAP